MIKFSKTKQYKTIQFHFHFIEELEKDAFAYRFLLTRLLRAHTDFLKSQKDFNKQLTSLYSLVIQDSFYLLENKAITKLTFSMTDYHFVDDNQLFGQVIGFMKDVLFDRKLFLKDSFNEVKRLCQEYVLSIKDRKFDYAKERFTKLMYPNQEYAHPLTGTFEEISNIELDELYDYYIRYFSQASLLLIVDGNLTANDEKLVKKVFEPYTKKALPTFESLALKCANQQFSKELSDTHATFIFVGYSLPITMSDDLYYAAVIANIVLGGFADSRLFLQFREQLGLAYDVESDFSSDRQSLVVFANVENYDYMNAYEELINIVNTFKTAGITNQELTNAKEYLVNVLQSAYDVQQRKAFEIFMFECLGIDLSNSHTIGKVRSVTIEQVEDVLDLLEYSCSFILHGDEKYET